MTPCPNFFQPEQIDEILTALERAPLKWRVMTTLYIGTGCRRGEIVGLKWSKVDFETNQILIDSALLYTKSHGVYEETTKTEDIRYLRLSDETMALLKKLKIEQGKQRLLLGSAWVDSDYVFVGGNGDHMHPDSVTGWLDEYAKKNGLPHINPHAFRHTAASVLIAHGIDIVTVSKQLGHAQPTTTENIYAHLIEANKAKASECLADVLLRKRTKEA